MTILAKLDNIIKRWGFLSNDDRENFRTFIKNTGGWKDLSFPVIGSASGSGAPASTAFGVTGNIKQTSFGVNDSIYLAGHWDHDIKVGSTVFPHVHWSTNGTNTGNVQWQLNYINAKGHNQENFGADVTLNLEEAAQGTAWRHMITEDATGFVAPEIDTLTIVELKRIAASSNECSDTVFGLFVDFHYEAQQYGSKNRSPNFYT